MEREAVTISPLLFSVVEEQKWVHGQERNIQLVTDSTQLLVQLHPLRIIISNLLRNSIEHGDVDIYVTQRSNSIEIVNSYSEQGHSGFGLGLLLVRRLAQQLGWIFEISSKNNLFISRLEIK